MPKHWFDRAVYLEQHTLRFKKLPPDVRGALVERGALVADIRQAIQEAAQVVWMPPIRILDFTFADTDAVVFGLAHPIEGANGRNYFGVSISGGLVACVDDEDFMRAILVHEFAHCFHYYEHSLKVPKALIRQAAAPSTDPILAETDKAILADPYDWFGYDDARSFIHHDDPAMALPALEIRQGWIDRKLPWKKPGTHFHSQVEVPIEVSERLNRTSVDPKTST